MRNTIKIILATASVALLAACGGGGGGVEQAKEEPIKITALVVLSNGQGVGRITGGDSVGLVYSPQITSFITGANAASENGESSSISLDPNNFPVVSTTQRTETRRGTITADGSTFNVTALKNNLTTDAGGIYFEVPSEPDILMVVGDPPSAIPTTGTATYTGFFTQNAPSVIAPGQIGTFVMNVNFGSRTFTINASTSSLALSGNGVINSTTGLYVSTNINVAINGLSYVASLYGNLNGIAAKSVSGLFHTNDSSPDFAGSFVGSK